MPGPPNAEHCSFVRVGRIWEAGNAAAIDLYEQLGTQCGDAWPLRARALLAKACLIHGLTLGFSQALVDEAIQLFDRAANLGDTATELPGFLESGMAQTLVRALGARAVLIRDRDGQLQGAEASARALQAAEEIRSLPDVDLEELGSTLARAYERAGDDAAEADEWLAMRRLLEAAVDLHEASRAGRPKYRWSNFLVRDWQQLSRAHHRLGDGAAAEASALEALRIGRDLDEGDGEPTSVGIGAMADASRLVAELRHAQDDTDAAANHGRAALVYYQRLRDAHPEDAAEIEDDIRAVEGFLRQLDG